MEKNFFDRNVQKKKKGALAFDQLSMSSNSHFVEQSFQQQVILLIYIGVILSTVSCIFMVICFSPILQLIITIPYHFISLSFCKLLLLLWVILLAKHFINPSFHFAYDSFASPMAFYQQGI
jgi:hypothetical protein